LRIKDKLIIIINSLCDWSRILVMEVRQL